MSLEQAIIENTKAVLNLTAILTNSIQAKAPRGNSSAYTASEVDSAVSAAAAKAADAAEPAIAAVQANITQAITLDQVQKAWLKWYGKDSKSALGMLDDFGVKKVSALKADDYAAALEIITTEISE